MRRLSHILTISIFFCLAAMSFFVMPPQAHAETTGKLKVGVYASAPFAYKDELGKWKGIAVDLWQAIAKDKGYDFDFVEVTRKEAVSLLAKGDLDVIAAGLSVSLERELLIDFSQPFYASHYAIAVIRKPLASIESSLLHVFLSWKFWAFVLCIGFAFGLVAILMWHFEGKENPEYHGPTKIHSIVYGIYWSVAMMTRAGERAPKTVPGRLIGILWLGVAVFLAGSFTASVTTALNVERLSRKISSERDLPNAYAAVFPGPCEKLLTQMNVRHTVCSSGKECYALLRQGRVDAIVGSEPILKYYAATNLKGELDIIPMDYDEVLYAIGLRPKSELTEEVNRAVLQITSTSAWAETLKQYLQQ
jgi:ABC-type amino acid transport substrate-binding protein